MHMLQRQVPGRPQFNLKRKNKSSSSEEKKREYYLLSSFQEKTGLNTSQTWTYVVKFDKNIFFALSSRSIDITAN